MERKIVEVFRIPEIDFQGFKILPVDASARRTSEGSRTSVIDC